MVYAATIISLLLEDIRLI